MRVTITLFGSVAVAMSCPSAAAPVDAHRTSAIPLETMTLEEIAAARTAGTGCTWLGGRGVTRRVAMKENRGVMKRDGMIVTLRPVAGAEEVFPYTYLHWAGGGMHVTIVNSGKEVGRGPEHVETIATLTLTKNGRGRSWPGRLNCGS